MHVREDQAPSVQYGLAWSTLNSRGNELVDVHLALREQVLIVAPTRVTPCPCHHTSRAKLAGPPLQPIEINLSEAC